MPTYEYACPDCGNKFELKQKFTDDSVKLCPRCGKRRVYRVVGNVAVSFKGSGWYITDSKSSSEKHTFEHKKKDPNSTDAPATDVAKTDGKGETISDNKSDNKAENRGETKTESKTETRTESKPESKPAAEKSTEKSKTS